MSTVRLNRDAGEVVQQLSGEIRLLRGFMKHFPYP
jgi:hypothetical protein